MSDSLLLSSMKKSQAQQLLSLCDRSGDSQWLRARFTNGSYKFSLEAVFLFI
jgi:hypothetical protein